MVGSVATTPVNHRTTRSRGLSTQEAAASRSGSWARSHASLAATEAPSRGSAEDRGPGPTSPELGARTSPRLAAGPAVRPQDGRAQRPAVGVDHHHGLAGTRAPDHVHGGKRSRVPGPAPDRRPPTSDVPPRPGSCSDHPGAGMDGLDRGAGRSHQTAIHRAGASGSHRATLVTLEPRSRVRITRRARWRPAAWPRRPATAPRGWPAHGQARPSPGHHVTRLLQGGPAGIARGGARRGRAPGHPTLATTRATASIRGLPGGGVRHRHLEQRRPEIVGDHRGQHHVVGRPGTSPRHARSSARSAPRGWAGGASSSTWPSRARPAAPSGSA